MPDLHGLLSAIALTLDDNGATHFNDIAAAAKKPGEGRKARHLRIYKAVTKMQAEGIIYSKGMFYTLTGRGYAAVAAWRSRKAQEARA